MYRHHLFGWGVLDDGAGIGVSEYILPYSLYLWVAIIGANLISALVWFQQDIYWSIAICTYSEWLDVGVDVTTSRNKSSPSPSIVPLYLM